MILDSLIPDGGPLYAETNLQNIFVEPWNAISSLIYLVPAIFCFYWIKKRYRFYSFLTLSAILLILGGIGSTMYHAFRSSKFFLALDVLPIQGLTLLTIMYFWSRLIKSRLMGLLLILLFVGAKVVLHYTTDGSFKTNMAYLINGIMLFLPIIVYMFFTRFSKGGYIVISILFFSISLFCRQIDLHSVEYLSMGTHWLWHIFSAIGSGFLGYYLYAVRTADIKHPVPIGAA
jgi:hypothetical protein